MMPNRTFLSLALAGFASSTLAAATISLACNKLPSQQGWTLQNNAGFTESELFSTCVIDTMGKGKIGAEWIVRGAIDPLLPFSVTTRVQVLDSETTMAGAPASAFGVGFYTGSENSAFSLNKTSIRTAFAAPVSIDATQWHTYRLEMVPRVSVKVFVDGVLWFSGAPRSVSGPNLLAFGDGSFNENVRVRIQSLTFSQGADPVPEPGTLLLLPAGLLVAFVRRRNRP